MSVIRKYIAVLSVPWCCVATAFGIALTMASALLSFLGVGGDFVSPIFMEWADQFAHFTLPVALAIHLHLAWISWGSREFKKAFGWLAFTAACIAFHLTPIHDSFLSFANHIIVVAREM